MNKQSLTALIVLNVVLLVALVVVTLTPQPVVAQATRPGDYIMVSGMAVGRSQQSMVYIVETRTSKMVALLFNSSINKFQLIDGRTINDDIVAAGGGR